MLWSHATPALHETTSRFALMCLLLRTWKAGLPSLPGVIINQIVAYTDRENMISGSLNRSQSLNQRLLSRQPLVQARTLK